MKRIVVCHRPIQGENPYTENVVDILVKNGFEVLSIRSSISNLRIFFSCKIYNFNWFEKVETPTRYIYRTIILTFLKLSGKKIVYTLHNKQPHDQTNVTFSYKMMKQLVNKADVIIGLCPDTKQVIEEISPNNLHKLRIVPHPSYINNYSKNAEGNLRSKFSLQDRDLVFLFIGSILKYKNLELLINTFKKIERRNVKLIIAGKPSSEEYKRELIELSEHSPHIQFDFKYIQNAEISDYYNTSDIVVLPYHKISSLNSGSVYLSFSFKKTVICPDIGTINGLEDKSFVYSYSYDSNEEHAKKFKNCVEQVCKDFEENPESLKEKGEKAYQYMLENHSDERIGAMYKKIYKELLGESLKN